MINQLQQELRQAVASANEEFGFGTEEFIDCLIDNLVDVVMTTYQNGYVDGYNDGYTDCSEEAED